MTPLVLVTEGSEPAPLAWLKERCRVISAGVDDPAANLAQADALVVRTYTKVDDALLDRAPRLRVVGRGGVGLENIDVAACKRRGVRVVYTPSANTEAVAQFVFGYMLRLSLPWHTFLDRALEPAEFKRIRNTHRGRQLDGLTLGILGMGRVGARVGSIAQAFRMRVIYNDLPEVMPQLDFPAERVDKPALWAQSDVLSIHVDMRHGNENLVGAAEIAQMKPDALLINTSRGEVVDAAALAAVLRSGRLSGAAIDVFHPEPPGPDFPLLGLPRVLLTPHIAARTQVALDNMSWVVRDVVAVLEGREPQYPAPDPR